MIWLILSLFVNIILSILFLCLHRCTALAFGHTWSKWISTVNNEQMLNGYQIRSCNVCGKAQTRDYR